CWLLMITRVRGAPVRAQFRTGDSPARRHASGRYSTSTHRARAAARYTRAATGPTEMNFETVVDTATLAAHLADPAWRVVDCRFDLGDPDAGAAAFKREHIPGAIYAHLDRDLSGPRTPWSGRHPLPEPEMLAATFGEFGIDAEVQVVGYDD